VGLDPHDDSRRRLGGFYTTYALCYSSKRTVTHRILSYMNFSTSLVHLGSCCWAGLWLSFGGSVASAGCRGVGFGLFNSNPLGASGARGPVALVVSILVQ